MIEYVLDAASGATGSRPIVVLLAGHRGRPRRGRGARRRRRSRTSRAAPATRSRAALAALARRGRGDPRRCRATSRSSRPTCSTALLEARALDHAAIALVVRGRASTPPASAASCATTAAPSSGSSRTRTRPTRSARSPRSTRACTRSTRRGCGAGSATCGRSPTTGELYLTDLVAIRPRGRPARRRARGRGRRAPHRHQRPLPARPRRVGHAGRAQRPLDAGRGHDARPVDRVPRPRGGPRRGRGPRAQRHPARRDARRRADADRDRDRRSSTRGSAADCVDLGERRRAARPWRTRSRSARSATCGPGAHVGPPLRDRQLRRDQEQPPRRARPPAPHELPRRRRRRRRTPTSAPGTITANYDGVHKHRTTIGEGVFLGVDTMLRAPVTLGDGVEDRRRRGRHAGRARRASSRSACRRGSARSAATRPRRRRQRPARRTPAAEDAAG